ncbi:MAG: SAM-dependent methyltransferase [Bacteroidetes bacterium RIFOXYA12_FULL_35_11]|nr:MAG: SAM-dependent methyltransferase [Bacteroidetes bacterium GWF2_35_48]OFY81030.1 MAG: SAM-dependent methyltransferase [Bacteroidetes bacterium RIFOXYA12_FULL_35_11]HBX49979.1 class I SAM-dependent methyltransferase [Bacteroidales bacterium]
MKQWYEEIFENFADGYDREIFTQGTIGEVDFFEKEINFNKNYRILDIGCGTGRHSLELARRGYYVTGIDLSDSLLQKAQQIAEEEKLKVRFLKKDARRFSFEGKFDLVLMICEGAFPLMETDEMNYEILKNAADSLNPGGKIILTTLNGLFPLKQSVDKFINEKAEQGVSSESNFDMMTFRMYSTYETKDDAGNVKILKCNERYYMPSEISWLLHSTGFKQADIFGCKLGAFSRNDELTSEDFEMLIVAEKN